MAKFKKRFLREKLKFNIGLRFCNFGSEMVENQPTNFCLLLKLTPLISYIDNKPKPYKKIGF